VYFGNVPSHEKSPWKTAYGEKKVKIFMISSTSMGNINLTPTEL